MIWLNFIVVDRVDGMIELTVMALCDYVRSNVSLDAKGTDRIAQVFAILTSMYNLIIGPQASPSYPERVWSKGCTNASSWNRN